VALGNKLGIRVNLWPPGQFDAAVPNAAKTELSTSPDRWRKDCEFPWDVPYVTTTGDILPCCAMSSRGNIQKKNFLDIWNGQQYRQLRASIRSVSPPAACEACPGRGWSAPSPPRTELVMGKDDRQLGLGWFELENHSTMSYRWTRQRATLFLLNSAQPVLSITWAGEQHPGAESQGVLRVQDQNVSRFVLDSAKFVEDLFVLPPTDGSLLKVDFELDKCWSPRDVIADSHDPRSLGIKIARVRLEGRRLFVRFANGAQLLGFDLLQTEAAPGSQVPLELFWTCDWPLEAGLVAFVHLQHFATVNWRIPFFITKRLPKPLRSAFQADYVPGASSEFHNRLQPGRIIRDKVMIQIPQDVRPGRYRLGVGLWQPAISPERIRIATADGAISEHAAILTQMTVCSQ